MALIIKVEKILKGSLDSISSPSVKIQIIGVTVCLRRKGNTLLGLVNKHFYSKVCWQQPTRFCLHTFPTHNLNFLQRWRWWDRIQAIFSNLFYFNEHSFITRDLGQEPLKNYACRFLYSYKKSNWILHFFLLQHVFFFRFLHLMPNPRMTLSW